MDNALEIKHLTKNYGKFCLSDVSLTLPAGAILGLIGENGAGKSTTIKCILGLVKSDAGEIRILGRDSGAPLAREDVGVVLDEPMFHELLTPRALGTVLARARRGWSGALFRTYLEKFSLPERKRIKEFSRGMKMKLALAAALAAQPRLLVLDEATSGLDPVVREAILDEFLAFIQDESHAILISSHITSDLEKVADYIAYLHQGRIALSGAKDALLEDHGRLACDAETLRGIDPRFLVGQRSGSFHSEALIRDRAAFQRQYPQLGLDPTTLEEIMLFTVRGDKR